MIRLAGIAVYNGVASLQLTLYVCFVYAFDFLPGLTCGVLKTESVQEGSLPKSFFGGVFCMQLVPKSKITGY